MLRIGMLLLVGVLLLGSAAWALEALGAPKNLRCEYTQNPVGLDVTQPRLSWELNDSRRAARQAAYQILVAGTETELAEDRGSVWDSGKVVSDQSIHVPYGGPALQSRQRCYWSVRTWDANGTVSPFSKPAFWEMGLLNAADWQAKWITIDEIKDKPEPVFGDWIWHPAENAAVAHAYFRKIVELPADAKVASATVWGTADNEFVFFLNGKEIGGGEEWKAVELLDIKNDLIPGRNVIAVTGENEQGNAGLTIGIRITLEGGQVIEIRSGEDWLATTQAPEGWMAADFDTKDWVASKLVAKYGDEPWGQIGTHFTSRSYCLRKAFDVPHKDIAQARVYVSALGAYRLFVNGQRIGQDELAPGWTHYPTHIMYQTYDVTPLIQSQSNAVGMILGNGWGTGMAGGWKDGNLRGIAQLEITFKNGEKQVVATDATWKGHPSPIVEDSIYNGEIYDAQLEISGWNRPNCDDQDWLPARIWDQPTGQLVAQTGPPIRVTEERRAVSVTEVKPGVFVFDFGQNAAGRTALRVRGPKGARVQIRHAEILSPDGNIYTANLRGAKATDAYILKGAGSEVWEPAFTYHGFRYAEVTGYPGTPAKDALIMRVMHTDVPSIGSFACSEEIINRVQKNMLWGMRSNFYSAPTDCPQRDERLGWTGDAQMFMATACWNVQVGGYMTKWLRDLVDSRTADGAITDVAPALRKGPGAPAWADVIVVVPWDLYTYYGDTRVIETNYQAMADWVKYMSNNANNGLYDREGYGDWVPVEPSPKKPIAGEYQYLCNKYLSQMARAIGKTAESDEYQKQADAVAVLFNQRYFNAETNQYEGNTQTANLVPLWFGITPEDKRAAVVDNLVKNIVDHGYHLTTGFIGTGYLMPALSTFGKDDVAWALAKQRTYPSWGHMVEAGGTTIFERWNSDQYEQVGPGMNSFNHFAFGSVGQWYYEYLAGIRPLEPGFKRVLIAPTATGAQWVKAAFESMYGLIRCEWRNEKAFSMMVEIPPNTTAVVKTPVPCSTELQVNEGKKIVDEKGATTFELGAGVYHFKALKR